VIALLWKQDTLARSWKTEETKDQLIMATAQMDPATVALNCFGHSLEYTYKVLSEISGVPASTVGYRNRRRISIQQRATNQQYLSP